MLTLAREKHYTSFIIDARRKSVINFTIQNKYNSEGSSWKISQI